MLTTLSYVSERFLHVKVRLANLLYYECVLNDKHSIIVDNIYAFSLLIVSRIANFEETFKILIYSVADKLKFKFCTKITNIGVKEVLSTRRDACTMKICSYTSFTGRVKHRAVVWYNNAETTFGLLAMSGELFMNTRTRTQTRRNCLRPS